MSDESSELVELCCVWGDPEALVIRSLLEQNGITCHFVSQADHKIHPFSIDGLGEVKIFVHRDRLAECRRIIDLRP